MLALAILLLTLAAVAQLMSVGGLVAERAKWRTDALLRCDSKLAELTAGATPLKDIADEAFPDDAGWRWSCRTSPGPTPELLLVEVTDERRQAGSGRGVSSTLQRFVRVPSRLEKRPPRVPSHLWPESESAEEAAVPQQPPTAEDQDS